ncbi:Coatomer subunit delta [Morella rubra]|uniref:Coatomer subunit delta n=1 Tax=Morella rubra TaxID=262757 RepID=A0A6A1VMR8_9ROSI|nr:Coatomer subunit delta [Morella rubra]
MNDQSTSRVLSEGVDGGDKLDSSSFNGLGGEEDGSGAKWALNFDSVAEESDVKGEDPSTETGEGDLRMEEPEKKQRSSTEIEGKNGNKKKRKSVESPTTMRTTKKLIKSLTKEGIILSNSVLSPRESCETVLNCIFIFLKTRDVSLKPLPIVQKPISSILEKIRKRKLEVSKKYVAMKRVSLMNEDDDDAFVREVVVDCNLGDSIDERGDDGVATVASEEAIELPANINSNLAVSPMDESNYSKDDSSHESIPSQMFYTFMVDYIDEEGLCKMAFELIFAFDEVISLGHKENVTVAQVKQHCEMESHEEKLHKLVLQSKINETKDHMKRKSSDIEKSKITVGGLHFTGDLKMLHDVYDKEERYWQSVSLLLQQSN